MRFFILLLATAALLGAAPPSQREKAPGQGVLCIAVFIYVAQQQGALCYAGDDPDFQANLLSWTERFDEYLIRNLPNGEADLRRFKIDEIGSEASDRRICTLDKDSQIYLALRDSDREKLINSIDKGLARDGPPTVGDCT